jgi:hypothetical protein
MAGLSLMIVLVVLTFLVQPATAHRKFALPNIASNDVDRVVSEARIRFGSSSVRHIRFFFEHSELLFVGFATLHDLLQRLVSSFQT